MISPDTRSQKQQDRQTPERERRESFEKNGFIVLRNILHKDALVEIRDEITQIGKCLVGKDFRFEYYDPQHVTPEKQSALYDRLHYLPSLSRLSGNKQLLSICKDLGMEIPVLMGCCNMRYDRPGD